MKKTLIKIFILFSVVFSIVSCNDPIFFVVHEETPLLKPYMPGTPTNYVVFNSKLYVGAGKKIFVYSKDATSGKCSWSVFDEPGGFIGCLAANNTHLYVQHIDSNGRITRYDTSNTKSSVSIPGNVQSIYASGNELFASNILSAGDNGFTYSIFHATEATTLNFQEIFKETTKDDYTLCGVASSGSYYYLCTKSKIFYTTSPSATLSTSFSGDTFTGIINSGSAYVTAISMEGNLYKISGTTYTKINTAFSSDRHSTGSLAVFYNGTTPILLLVGRRDKPSSSSTGYTYGYVEIALDASGELTGTSFSDPGTSSSSSIDNYDSYVSSLGKNPINYMFQTPSNIDPNMTLFASTQQKGVWSYRTRDGEKQWNSEQAQNED